MPDAAADATTQDALATPIVPRRRLLGGLLLLVGALGSSGCVRRRAASARKRPA